MRSPFKSGGVYFLTFIDDKSRYVWVYILKHKDDVFPCFLEWKALVERSTNQKLKALRTDNGGEYMSTEFQTYLKKEGVRHELTVPKTPEQNGVAERMNVTGHSLKAFELCWLMRGCHIVSGQKHCL